MSTIDVQPNDVSESINIPRKRGRKPKSKNVSTKDIDDVQPNDASESINFPRKRGRKPKSKNMSAKNVDDVQPNHASESINIPRKRGRKPKLKNMPIADIDVVQPSDTSECINIPRKRGRKPKSKILSNDIVSCNTRRNPQCQIAGKNSEAESRQLKLFPIFFNSSIKLQQEDNIKDKKKGPTNISSLQSVENKTDNLAELECLVIDQQSTPCNESAKINVFHDSFCSDIDLVVSETVQSICLRTEQAVDSANILVLSDIDQLAQDKLSLLKQANSKLRRIRKGMENNMPNMDVLYGDILEVSNRRKSLRSGGARNYLINYSDIDSCVAIPEKQQNCRLQVYKSSNDKCDDCTTLNIDTTEYSLKVGCNNSLRVLQTGENEKDKFKLFPIFASNKAISEETNHLSNKRKAPWNEGFLPNDANISVQRSNKNILCRNKKVRNESNVERSGEESKIPSSVLNCENMKSNNCNEKLPEITKAAEKHVEANEKCKKLKDFAFSDTKILDEECINGSEESVKISHTGVLKKSDSKNICFPVLSHLSICNESLSETVNRFLINSEDSDCDFTVPVWNELQGFIDVDCTKLINSKVNYLNTGKKPENYFTSAPSDLTATENDENLLWTDSVQNTIGKEKKNEVAVNEVKSWLLQWKNKFCKNLKMKKSHSDSESFSSDSDSDDDFVSNSIIIYGAPGSGKTNLVFSLANELGFTVLEVNASSSRNGRNISHQLKEALESYHVESIKIENSFENTILETKTKCNTSNPEESNICTKKSIKSFFELENKNQCKENIKSKEKKQNITKFFQVNASDKKGANSKHRNNKKKVVKGQQKEIFDKEVDISGVNCKENLKSDKNSCRISNLTIILFDDVDVVFEEDEGFWSTVKGFLKISKKPVIFTVGRNLSVVKTMLNSDIPIFNMKPTSKEFALNALEAYCKKHSRKNKNSDLELLTSHNLGDLRRNILNAQFWTQNPTCVNDVISVNDSKFLHVNSFTVGELHFSADEIRKLLFHHVPNYFLNAVSQYQSLGYDVLYTNLFYILKILDSLKYEREWETLSFQKSCISAKSFSDSQMWEEACEIFKLKKRALKSGACSKELNLFADTISDFSFADILKGLSSNKFQWISVSERIKLWTAGLPICCDHSPWPSEDILELVSLINIYSLRRIQTANYFKYRSSNDIDLILEHPFMMFDQAYAYPTEDDLKCLSSALPPTQQLNRPALTLDYLSIVKIMCQDEESRHLNSGKRSGRFLHYFDSISFLIDKRTF